MISCYLDSQDYSTLTDPKSDTPDRRAIAETLRHLARSKQVRFAFSAAAVCEAVAITPDASRLAELKAELLSDLCGSNALVSFDRLLNAEVKALVSKSGRPVDMFDPQGRWFPEIPVDESPQATWDKMKELAQTDITIGSSRQQRRAKARLLIKNGKPRAAFKAHMEMQDPSSAVEQVLKSYPMKVEHAEMMVRYGLGRATEREFTEALMDSLADPRWMMKWFTNQHAMSSPIADLVRKPGRELGNLMRALADSSKRWAEFLKSSGLNSNRTAKSGEIALQWQEMERRQLVAVTQKAAVAGGFHFVGDSAADVEIHCPGITAAIKSLYSSVWENVGGGRKEEPSDSQPVDAIHALYAPYVQVFRADRFMAPHIQKYVKGSGTIVVPKLTQLVKTLETQVR